jgi:hypothetical protein
MSATQESANMIFYILVTVFVLGFALLSGILSVMRELYAFSTFQGPLIPNDCRAKVSLDDGHEQPHQGGSEIVDWRRGKSLQKQPCP